MMCLNWTYLQKGELGHQGGCAVKGLLDDRAKHDLQVTHARLELCEVLKPAGSFHIQDILVTLGSPQRMQQLLEGALQPKTAREIVASLEHGKCNRYSLHTRCQVRASMSCGQVLSRL